MSKYTLAFQRLDIFIAAKDFACLVYAAKICDRALRDQATRAVQAVSEEAWHRPDIGRRKSCARGGPTRARRACCRELDELRPRSVTSRFSRAFRP